MKKLTKILAGLSLVLGFSGCGDTEDLFDTGSSSGGADSLKLEKMTDGNFNITWTKKYSGYSEAVYKEDGSSNSRGKYFLTGNSDVKYTMECLIINKDINQVNYSCENTNGDAPTSLQSKIMSFKSGKTYTFYTSEGLEHSLKSAGTILYDGTNNSIGIN